MTNLPPLNKQNPAYISSQTGRATSGGAFLPLLRRLLFPACAGVSLLWAASALADGPSQPRLDPEVIKPACAFLSFTCHVGFDYDEPESDSDLPQSRPAPEPAPEVCG